MGKADVPWEETSRGTMGSAGVRVQAPEERFAEITPGRTDLQQESAATCTDLRHKGEPEAAGGFRSGA